MDKKCIKGNGKDTGNAEGEMSEEKDKSERNLGLWQRRRAL